LGKAKKIKKGTLFAAGGRYYRVMSAVSGYVFARDVLSGGCRTFSAEEIERVLKGGGRAEEKTRQAESPGSFCC